MERIYKDISPCMQCTRVKDPQNCENKNCRIWQQWFIRRWDMIRAFPRYQMDAAPAHPVGVSLGGRVYAAPHQVEDYLKTDPCESCGCPRELCVAPCRVKRNWGHVKKEVKQ